MPRKFLTALLSFSLAMFLTACDTDQSRHQAAVNDDPWTAVHQPPRLVVGIVVDQMRHDYFHRYWDKFGDDGFKRLLGQGFSFDNARFDYMPTYTGPGHASVYTGTTPAVHGIISNWWYSRELGETLYVTSDPDHATVGAEGAGGEMSPRWLLSTTVGDELHLHTAGRSRVVGISLKDRSAILPAGHTGDAYWLDYGSGKFITSTYYRESLPGWVSDFNERNLVEHYLGASWETLLPIDQYTESIADDNPHEAPFRGQPRPVFPHPLPELVEHHGLGLVASTPFGNDLLVELAIAALEGEALGRGETPDMLAMSFSATDHVGHQFGPASVEVQDTYLRLDRQIARLLDYLDEHYGRDNVLVFLTSDHGVPHIPSYLEEKRIPAGYFDHDGVTAQLRALSESTWGIDLVEDFSNHQVFLDHHKVAEAGLDLAAVRESVARHLLAVDGVAGVLTADALQFGEFRDGVRAKVQRGYHARRSGDVVSWLEPNWMPKWHASVPTTHGSPYNYDTRAPLVWYGWRVPPGRSTERVHISDIASTLAIMLDAPFPGANTGNPLNHHMER